MIELPENFDSIFRYIEVVSQRAEQIIKGARPRADVKRAKPTLQARDDVDAGAVDWRIQSQEELDAQRQAMVEQFRAEMESVEEDAVDGIGPVGLVDVLPTSGGDGPALDAGVFGAGEDGDDELRRLQRLLGMTGAKISDVIEEDSDEDNIDFDFVVDPTAADPSDSDELDEKG